ncbi:MAG: hypothetical protein ACLFP2_04880 [Candidatus Woesearchaeota archaeon]
MDDGLKDGIKNFGKECNSLEKTLKRLEEKHKMNLFHMHDTADLRGKLMLGSGLIIFSYEGGDTAENRFYDVKRGFSYRVYAAFVELEEEHGIINVHGADIVDIRTGTYDTRDSLMRGMVHSQTEKYLRMLENEGV